MNNKGEHYFQTAAHKYLTYMGIYHFAVPLGGKRDLKVAMSLKAEGALAGVSDLILVLPKRIVFVELKNGKEGRQSDAQKEFQKNIEALGFEYFLIRDMQEIQALCGKLLTKSK